MNPELCRAFRMGFGLFLQSVSSYMIDWRSPESASTFCNLLVLLWLFIIVITALFILHSHQLLVRTHHNNFRITLYRALRWSCCADFERLRQVGLLILLAFFMSMVFSCWNQSIDLCCESGDWVLCGTNIDMKKVKCLSLLPSNY